MGVVVLVTVVVVVVVIVGVVVVVAMEVVTQPLPAHRVQRFLRRPLPIEPLLRLARRPDPEQTAEAELPAGRRATVGADDAVSDRRRGEDLVRRAATIAAIVDELHSDPTVLATKQALDTTPCGVVRRRAALATSVRMGTLRSGRGSTTQEERAWKPRRRGR
jgi:hypothetical protein